MIAPIIVLVNYYIIARIRVNDLITAFNELYRAAQWENGMNKRITFRDMPHSEVMEQMRMSSLKRLSNFLDSERSPIYIDLVLAPSKVREHHLIELRVKSPNYELYSTYEGAHFYDVLDRVIDTTMVSKDNCVKKRTG